MSAYSEIEEAMPVVFNYLEEWGASHKNVPYTGKSNKVVLITGKLLFAIARYGVLSKVVTCETVLANKAYARAKETGTTVKRTPKASNIHRVGGYEDDFDDIVIPVDMFESEMFESRVALDAIKGPRGWGIVATEAYIRKHNTMKIIPEALRKSIHDLREIGEDDLADELEDLLKDFQERKEDGTSKGIAGFIDNLFDQIYGIYEAVDK